MDGVFSKEIITLINWFTAHLCSAYAKTDESTKKHIDGLYLEFNRRWKMLIKGAKNTEQPTSEEE